jgi:hypothetical protein
MEKLSIEIKNCYGIGSLKHEINYQDDSVGVIYAPNGTMKTSLTKTFQCLIEGKTPCDEIYTSRKASSTIQIDGNDITQDNVYIFANEEKDATKQISTFLVDKNLKTQYDAIFNQINQAKTTLIKQLKTLSKSTDCESEIIDAFKENENDSFFDCLLRIDKLITENAEYITLSAFKYNDLFDKGHKVEQFIKDNKDDIQQYFAKYMELLQNSMLFSAGAQSFGTTHASALLKSVADNRFFAASHEFRLHNDLKTISSKTEMQDVIDTELKRIYSDDTIKALFEKIDKKLQSNTELKNFQDVIQNHKELVPELINYEALRRKVLLGYIVSLDAVYKNVLEVYQANIEQIKKLFSQANASRSQWENVIEIFNSRFFVPFKLELQNKADILFNQVVPELFFVYQDGNEAPIKQERKVLLEHLSKGEKHAFFILQNLFELEARKATRTPTLIVLDDVADSFDYKNKYAIIEYLSDIAEDNLFKMLILTHNFDFYRTTVSRLQDQINANTIFFVSRNSNNREIVLKQGIWKPDILKRRIIDKLNQKRPFLSCIPFARNIIEYTKGDNNDDYALLTACLHIKDVTPSITLNLLKNIFFSTLAVRQSVKDNSNYGTENYLSALYQEAEEIMIDDNDVELTNKLVLSMAIRLKAEQYMKSILTAEQLLEMRENANQTGELVKIFKKYHMIDKEKEYRLLNQVLMLTSENIHINNFMFEPLVDISILYLKDLYSKMKALLK